MNRNRGLFPLTLGAIVLGADYFCNLIPGLPAFLSLNRSVFLVLFLFDLLFFSEKYRRSGPMALVCAFILAGCLPFLVFGAEGPGVDPLASAIELLGIFVFLLFFYVNCRTARAAGRVATVLFLSSGLVAAYVAGSQLGLVGYTTVAWRGDFQYTSASGIFDPNILTLNFLPVFAFGPLIRFRLKKASRGLTNFLIVLYIAFCFAAFFHLNTRSGSLAVAAALVSALALRFVIVPREERGGRLNAVLFFAVVAAALVYVQAQYDIVGPTLSIFGETYLETDTSFGVRLASYRYFRDSLLSFPRVFGGSYREFWAVTEWVGAWPHCALVDVYIKGGLLYLGSYLFLCLGGLALGWRGSRSSGDAVARSAYAGFFCFLLGFLPLMITLSIDGEKMPWAIFGCVFGLAAGRHDRPVWRKRDE